ncbi:MAG: uracil-DNA glycosylase [Candidatus Delongbacteria bacterium]
MSSPDSYRSLLLELLRRDLIKYLNFRSRVYSEDLPLKTEGVTFGYRLIHSKNKQQDKMKNFESLKELEKTVLECRECALHKTRNKVVFGKGSAKERLVIIGEAPGGEEDKTGIPFVGRAGQLLTKMLAAINIERENVYICNVLKCRPPNNRDPLPEEIRKCSFYLDKQLEFLKPRYILALGRIAAQRLLGIQTTMKELRGAIHNYKDIPVIVTYHPSALLRNSKWKYPAWEDLKKLKELLDKPDA